MPGHLHPPCRGSLFVFTRGGAADRQGGGWAGRRFWALLLLLGVAHCDGGRIMILQGTAADVPPSYPLALLVINMHTLIPAPCTHVLRLQTWSQWVVSRPRPRLYTPWRLRASLPSWAALLCS